MNNEWDPCRSKLRAAMEKGMKIPFTESSIVLYLGAAEGNTAARIAEIVGKAGAVFCVEIAPTPFQKLLALCESKENLVPILADANHPEKYADLVPDKVDVVYQDVSQKNQTEIFLKNARRFLKPGGITIIAIKAACIDTTGKPEEIFKEEIEKLKKEMVVREVVSLEPFEHGHVLVVCDCRSNRGLVCDCRNACTIPQSANHQIRGHWTQSP